MEKIITKSTQSGRIYHQVHKVDELTTKSTKWTNLLSSPQNGQVYYSVHKVDEFIIKVHKVDKPITKSAK